MMSHIILLSSTTPTDLQTVTQSVARSSLSRSTMQAFAALLGAAFFTSASAQVAMDPQTVVVGAATAATLTASTSHMCWVTGTAQAVTPIATTDCLVEGSATAFGTATTAVCGASGAVQAIDFDFAANRFLSVIECTGVGTGVGPAVAVEITVASTASIACPVRADYSLCAEWDVLPTCADISQGPTMAPSAAPTGTPTQVPSHAPSAVTDAPTAGPTAYPTACPTAYPTAYPTAFPSTSVPTAAP